MAPQLRLLPLAAVATSFCLATAAKAHLGSVIYPIYELSSSQLPDLHDETLEDWEDVLPRSSFDHTYFENWDAFDGLLGAIDPENLAVRVFLGWHQPSSQLYVAVERVDDVYLPNYDVLRFEVDGDHSDGQFVFIGDEYGEAERLQTYAHAQSYHITSSSFTGEPEVVTLSRLEWTTRPPWADFGFWHFGERPTVSGVEFRVTLWDTLVHDDPDGSRRTRLDPGRILGFHLRAADSDVAGRVSANYMLAIPAHRGLITEGNSTYPHFGFAGNFVDGELVPCFVDDCSRGTGTAVQVSSWARIKATLNLERTSARIAGSE